MVDFSMRFRDVLGDVVTLSQHFKNNGTHCKMRPGFQLQKRVDIDDKTRGIIARSACSAVNAKEVIAVITTRQLMRMLIVRSRLW